MPGSADGNGDGLIARPLAEEMLARVARLIDQEADPDRLDTLAEAAIELLRHVTAQRRVLRVPRVPQKGASAPIEWLTAKEVATLIHRSESTVRHMDPAAIPGRRQQAKGYKVEWNKQVVLDWLAECSRH